MAAFFRGRDARPCCRACGSEPGRAGSSVTQSQHTGGRAGAGQAAVGGRPCAPLMSRRWCRQQIARTAPVHHARSHTPNPTAHARASSMLVLGSVRRPIASPFRPPLSLPSPGPARTHAPAARHQSFVTDQSAMPRPKLQASRWHDTTCEGVYVVRPPYVLDLQVSARTHAQRGDPRRIFPAKIH